MLTSRPWSARTAWTLLVVALMTLASALFPSSASAGHCTALVVEKADGTVFLDVTHCHTDGTTDPGGSGSGGAGYTCDLSGIAEYCLGDGIACWANVPSALDPATWPEDTRPSPDAIYTYQSCTPDPGGLSGWNWYTPDVVSVEELAQQAFATLSTPTFSIGFSPPGRAVVGVSTWYWAQTAQSGVITSSSALGVVAIGEPGRLQVDPGDGTPVLTCPWSTTASDACGYTYTRSSAGQPEGPSGLPAYTARARLVYDIRFENNGAPLVVPGLPVTLESPWQETSLPVAEIQALVGSGR